MNAIAALPKYHELARPTLLALQELGGSAHRSEVDERVISTLGITDGMLAVQHESGSGTVVATRLNWARTRLKMAGLLSSGGRGVWTLTEHGIEAIGWSQDKLRRELTASGKASKRPKASASSHTTELGATIESEVAEDWKATLLTTLRSMDPSAFERLNQRLLRESNFVKVEVTGRSGDGGIDGTGIMQLSLLSFHVLFQCKRYQGSVGAGAVRDFRGAMIGRTDKGLIITTGTFSPDARREATRDGAPPIDLIDGEALCEKLKEMNLGVDTRMVEEVTIRPEWFEAI